GAVTIGTRQEPLDRTVDDPRVDAGAPLVAEAEALEDPWRVVVEQDVGPTHQSGEDLAPGLALQIDRQAALVAVQGVEGAAAVRHRPGLVATPRLLDPRRPSVPRPPSGRRGPAVCDISRCSVARLLLWHGEQGGTPGTILDVGDVRMGLEYPP